MARFADRATNSTILMSIAIIAVFHLRSGTKPCGIAVAAGVSSGSAADAFKPEPVVKKSSNGAADVSDNPVVDQGTGAFDVLSVTVGEQSAAAACPW